MQKIFKPARVTIIFILMAALLVVYVSALYRMQVYDTAPAEEDPYPQKTFQRYVTLPAARGNIYDRNGVLLASGRQAFNVTLNRTALLYDPDRNQVIQELLYITMDEDVQYNDTFPITRGAPFTYVSDMKTEQQRRLKAYLEFFKLAPDISASDLLAWMRTHYGIDYTVGIADARLIIGVRYELEIRAIIGTLPPYVFASDVSNDFVARIEERSLTGVYIETGYIRDYHTSYAAHLLGYIGPITQEQTAKFVDTLGYPMDAQVGQMGAELAFESQLHGIDGKQTITMSDDGTVLNVDTTREPEPGKHVYLTMDIDLQEVVEHALSAHIDLLNATRAEESDLITSGAAVVTDVWTGEVLASASYPTYDPATLSRDIATIRADPTLPMFNRATQGRFSPGSTFKMVTAYAGLHYGTIGRYTEINDVGKYTKYADVGFQPCCWYYTLNGVGHGPLNVVQALERSCNYFFITVADWLQGGGENGARALASAAQEFGLGRATGLEIPENTGTLATPEWKAKALKVNNQWYSADTILTGFGQGFNKFTPVQLCNYAATIADGGVLHSLTLLRRIKSADFSELLFTHEPEVLNTITDTDNIAILQEGMNAVTRGAYGTAKAVFGSYPVHVAAKTGTVQVEGADINDGVFVCYAPAENPQIAISVVVEKGGSGSAVMDIARLIFDYYFRTERTVLATPFGELIP